MKATITEKQIDCDEILKNYNNSMPDAKANLDSDMLKQVMQAYETSGEYDKALDLYDKMPQDHRMDNDIILAAMAAAEKSNDYQKILEIYGDKYGFDENCDALLDAMDEFDLDIFIHAILACRKTGKLRLASIIRQMIMKAIARNKKCVIAVCSQKVNELKNSQDFIDEIKEKIPDINNKRISNIMEQSKEDQRKIVRVLLNKLASDLYENIKVNTTFEQRYVIAKTNSTTKKQESARSL